MKHQKSKIEKAELTDREKHPHPNALDKWNDRIDRNLESEKEGNILADENARDYSEKHGSGDQSDED